MLKQLCKRLKDIIKDQDSFGYDVSLTFNNSGRTHNTLIGGILSIFVYIFMMSYFYSLYKKINVQRWDDVSSNIQLNDLT